MRWLLRHKRLILAIVVVVAIVVMAMWPESMEVDVATVARGPLQVTIDEEGETRVQQRFVISAPVSGRLQRIELEPGDRVFRGKTLLARLVPAEAPLIDPRTRSELLAAVEASRAAVGQAQAERERAATALARARTTLQRREELAKGGAIARDDVEAAQTAVRAGEEAVRAAEFTITRTEYELQLARARLQAPTSGGQPVDVIAPVDAVVLRRLRESETVVPPGEPLLELGDPSAIEVVADLLSTDAVRVPEGAPVLVEQWGGPDPLKGRVRRVEPSGFMKVSALGVEEQRVNVIIDVNDIPPSTLAQGAPSNVKGPGMARRLGDGYRVEVRVVVWEAPDVVKVPVGTLFRRGDQWAVFVVDGGIARQQTVQLGQRSDVEAQIAGGLSPGQTVVLHPPDTLTEGARVTIRSAAAGS
jgi:HlyD family secretion protein